MDTGIARVMARMSEIQDKIEQVCGQSGDPPATGSFAQTLTNAQNQSPSASNPLPPLPVAPHGQAVRPLSAPATSAEIAPLVQSSAAKYGVNPDLVSAVIQTESGGNPNAVSNAGAMGLMQLMPSVASEAGISDPFDPAQNIDAGTKKLAGLLSEYGGNLDYALAAYNAGGGAVQKYGGVPPYPETQNYIQRVRRLMGAG